MPAVVTEASRSAVYAYATNNDPDLFQEFTYPSILFANLAISDCLALPLAKLSPEKMAFIDTLLTETLKGCFKSPFVGSKTL